ncbi:hypothetical protein R1sor_015174 [Riccia sorocarpa]|uniref:Uncharacterized protein n=1 Tax=Riccia sorocarpa TaxID=122646 RepID=A0ABD3HFC7_9MARC
MLAAEARFLNQAIMDGNLPGMDVHMPQTYHQDQSNEEMKQLLLCATLELQSVKAEERAHEAKLRHHEAQLRHLQDALFKVRKERDEYRDKCNQLQARLSRSPSRGSGMSDGITVNLSSVQQQMDSVSSMPENIRTSLSEVHRHLQEQQQQMDFPQMEIHQQMDLPHHHMVADLDLEQETDHQISAKQLEQLQQQLEIQQQQHDEQSHEQLSIDIRSSPDRHSVRAQCGEERNNSSNNCSNNNSGGTSWGVQIKMHGSDQSCSLMDESLRLQMELSQQVGVSGSHHLDQHSPSLDDFHGHLQQEQQMQMQLQQLHQQQQREESELLLAHMQQRNMSSSHMHIPTDDQQPPASCQSRMTDGQDVVMSVLQNSGWQRKTAPPPQSCSSVVQNVLSSSVNEMGTVSVSSFSMSSPPTGSVSSFSMASPPLPGAGAGSSFSMSSPPIPSGTGAVSSYSRSSPTVQSGHHPAPSQLLQNGSAVASILSPLDRYSDSAAASLLAPRPMHLPEPPEANAQVILSTLPEKGKLLQAVMQAGPLLQTLMVAGPLPQWRHPPPAIDSLEIPRVPMSAPTLPVGCSMEHSSSGNVVVRSSNLGNVMRMSNSSMISPNGGLCHTKTMPSSTLSSLAAGFDSFSSNSAVHRSLSSQRSLPQRLPLSSSHLSHDMSLLGPPMKYAKIH